MDSIGTVAGWAISSNARGEIILQITHGNPDIPTELAVAHLKMSVEAARQLGDDLRANAADQSTA